MCSESRSALWLPYGDLVVSVEVAVEVCCCCVTFHCIQICRKCQRIKLNGLRPVQTLVDITNNTFYKYTATLQTHCITPEFLGCVQVLFEFITRAILLQLLCSCTLLYQSETSYSVGRTILCNILKFNFLSSVTWLPLQQLISVFSKG